MKLLITGIQGSGKGTHAKQVQDAFGVIHISSGDLLREHINNQTEIGIEYEREYKKGNLAPDNILFSMIKEALNDEKVKKCGFILDGFPRTVNQLIWFNSNYRIDKCIHLYVDDKLAIERMKKRNRKDDNDKAIKKRLTSFYKETAPIVDYFREKGQLMVVDSSGSVENVGRKLVSRLNKMIKD